MVFSNVFNCFTKRTKKISTKIYNTNLHKKIQFHINFYVPKHIESHTKTHYFIGITKSAEYFVYFMQIGQMEEGRGGPTKKHLEYVSDSLFDMKLTYIYIYICYFISRPLVRHRCLKSTKPAAHHSLTSMYVYVDRFLCTFVYTSQDQVTFNMYP